MSLLQRALCAFVLILFAACTPETAVPDAGAGESVDAGEPVEVDPSLCEPGRPCLELPLSLDPANAGYLLVDPDALAQICFTGSDLGDGGTLHFGETVVPTLLWRPDLICVSPESLPSEGDEGRPWIESGGRKSNSFPNLTMPRIVGVSPKQATVGEMLTFQVENLGPARFLKFGSLPPEFVMAGHDEVHVVATTPGLFCPEIRKASFKAAPCVFAEVTSAIVEGCHDTRQNGCTLTGVLEEAAVSIGGLPAQRLEGALQSRFRRTYARPEELGPGTWVVRLEGTGGAVEVPGTLVPGSKAATKSATT